jgi:hypothetical protein
MRIPRTTWNAPGVTVMNPRGTVLKQDFMAAKYQDSGSTI